MDISERMWWEKRLKPLKDEMRRRKLISVHDMELLEQFKMHTQEEFCQKILRGSTFKSCLGWYNSY